MVLGLDWNGVLAGGEFIDTLYIFFGAQILSVSNKNEIVGVLPKNKILEDF